MKRVLLFALSLVFTISLLTLAVCAEGVGAEGETVAWWEIWKRIDTEAMGAWLETEVLPHVASVSVILGVALVELIPAVRSLIRAKAAFAKVASDVDAYNQAKIEYDLRVEEREKAFEARMEEMQKQYNKMVTDLCQTVETYEKKLSESEGRLASVLHNVEVSTDKTERMVYLGMSNSGELVTNGAARKIAEVKEETEGKEAGTDEEGM